MNSNTNSDHRESAKVMTIKISKRLFEAYLLLTKIEFISTMTAFCTLSNIEKFCSKETLQLTCWEQKHEKIGENSQVKTHKSH